MLCWICPLAVGTWRCAPGGVWSRELEALGFRTLTRCTAHHAGGASDAAAGWAEALGVKGNTKVKLMLLKHRPGQSLEQLIKDAMSEVPPPRGPLANHLMPWAPVQHLMPYVRWL